MRIGEINDFWGISYCSLFTLAFACKPCNVLCISLTLPSQAFWAMWKVLMSSQAACSSLLMWRLVQRRCSSAWGWVALLQASLSQIWTCTWDQTFPGCYSVHLPGISSRRKPLKEDQGSVVLSYSQPSFQSLPCSLSLWAQNNWNPTWTMHFPYPHAPQISYLYKHFLDCLSSHTAQELKHNLTEQTAEQGDLWFFWVRLQVVFVPIKQ